jgi:succinate dehydrogenase / fumarate reductase cytochrome b subunit
MSSAPKPRTVAPLRPKYYDLNLTHLPPPGLLSILHRISGALLFLAIPVLLYLLQGSLTSEQEYLRWRDFFRHPLVKLVAIGLAYLYAHHFFAGLRYLLLDLHVGLEKAPANTSAKVVLALGVLSAIVFGWCIW